MFFTTSRPIDYWSQNSQQRLFEGLLLFSKVWMNRRKPFLLQTVMSFGKLACMNIYCCSDHLWWQIMNFYETLIYSVWLKNWHILNNLLIVMPEFKQQCLYSCWRSIAFTLNSINISIPLKSTAILMIFNKSETHFTRSIRAMNKWHLYEVYSDPKTYQDS